MKLSVRYISPALILIIVFSVIPAGLVILLSLYKTNFLTWSFVGVKNYVKLFTGSFPVAAGNSLLYLLCIPIPGSVIALIIALSMADFKKKILNKMLFVYMLPSFAAGIIISQFWKWIMRVFEIDVSQRFIGVPFLSLTIVTATIGPAILLLSMAIKNIDPTIYEAAQIDGANWRQIKTRIILPNVLGPFSVILLFSLVGALQIWETIYMLAPFESTASMMFRVIQDGFMFGKYGLAAAECVAMAIVIMAITQIKKRVEIRSMK